MGVVNTIVTELAYIRVTPQGLVLEEIAPGSYGGRSTGSDGAEADRQRRVEDDGDKIARGCGRDLRCGVGVRDLFHAKAQRLIIRRLQDT